MERYVLAVPGIAPGKGTFESVRAPYGGDVVGEVELADAATLARALEVQSAIVSERAWLPAHRRIAVLREAAAIMRGRSEELALRIAREGGKPLTDARIEVARAIDGVDFLAGEAARHAGREIPMGATPPSEGRLALATTEPIGIVAAVSAFNHPLNLIVHQAGPAVAAGCPVILKPAPPTPLSGLAFIEILHEAGLPPEACIALPCSNEVAEQLVTSERIAFFSFIGSARVGWMLRSKLAPGVRCALEHGGAAPVIVDESAELDKAVPGILKGGFYHAGQVCVSVQRVYAHRSLKDELVERLRAGIAELVTGDPTQPETEVGPLIRQGEVERVDEWVKEAVAAGAGLVCGGEPLGNQCYAPTLLVDSPEHCRVMRQEIFGPVVSVVGFDDLDDAIARANDVPWAFQAAIYGQDVDRLLRAGRRLDATGVMLNDHTAFRVDWMPFGGRRQSGLGMGGMPYTLEDVTQTKMLVFNG